MNEKLTAVLSLIAIAVLVAAAQTMDYNEQQARAATPTSEYVYWHREMLDATRDNMSMEERAAYLARWKEENPELAPIIETRWREPKSQKVARQ